MKKILLITALLAMLLLLAACGKTSVHTNDSINITANLEKEITLLKQNMVSKDDLPNYTDSFLTEEEIKNMVGTFIKNAHQRTTTQFSCDERCSMFSEMCLFAQVTDGSNKNALVDCMIDPSLDEQAQEINCFCGR